MILAVIDDLMMRSRVSTAAKAAGADVRFAANTADAEARARELPAFVIVDLNARALDAVGLVGRLKGDPATAALRIMGFVSHVDGPAIEAARAAGIDDVLARGAFVTHLPDILGGAGGRP